MRDLNFIAVGRNPGKCIFVHKDNADLLTKPKYGSKIKCIPIEFKTGDIGEPVIVDVLLRFVPYTYVGSLGERQVISDLVRESLSEETIQALNKKFEEIRYQE
jgi:hypothetical protein